MQRFLPCVLAILAVTAVSTGHAGQTVLFGDGRSLDVDDVRVAGQTAVLILDSGGQIAVPAELIVNRDILRGSREPQLEKRPVGMVPRELCEQLTQNAARRHSVDQHLLLAMVEVGSAFDATALSARGAGGLMQLTPEIAESVGVEDVFDPSQSVEGGALHLSRLLARFNGRTDLALAAYRTGVRAVERHRGVPPYRETRRYVDRVLEIKSRLAGSG